MSARFRIEKDYLGEVPIPAEALYGVQTARAVANFPVSGMRLPPAGIEAYVHLKRAAAEVNMSLLLLDRRVGRAIVRAADEVLRGRHREHFVVDAFQAGAGTSTNMNVNEVLANRALEILGKRRGDYASVSPNDHVNMAQSTNDSYPTAMRLAALLAAPPLLEGLARLESSLAAKARAFRGIVKSGRTHLQDALPVTLGQEFGAWGKMMGAARLRIEEALRAMEVLGIGGTAVGTGVNAHPDYPRRICRELSRRLKRPLKPAPDRFASMESLGDFAHLSGTLRVAALELAKIANDLRLLQSGPMTGLGEIDLPAVQPGSSIMPGKVNPSIPEMADMVAFQVQGCDQTIALAAQAGQLELNVMMPVLHFNLLLAMQILGNASRILAQKCVSGIRANVEVCRRYFERTPALATVLNPAIGYARAAEVVKQAVREGRSIREILAEKGYLTPAEMDRVFDPKLVTRIGIPALLLKKR